MSRRRRWLLLLGDLALILIGLSAAVMMIVGVTVSLRGGTVR